MLVPSDHDTGLTSKEWDMRRDLLNQAQAAVKAVKDKGFVLESAPRIEFAGDYVFMDYDHKAKPYWTATAELRMEVYPV